MQPKKTKRQTQGPTRLYELFLLTVPIEELARWQYKTVIKIFLLNLQTIILNFKCCQFEGRGRCRRQNAKSCVRTDKQPVIVHFLLETHH